MAIILVVDDDPAMRETLAMLPSLRDALENCHDASGRDALGVERGEAWIDACEDVHAILQQRIADDPPLRVSDGGALRTGFDKDLDEWREVSQNGQRLIVELEARLREESSIPTLKLRFTRVFGWYIEVTRSHTCEEKSFAIAPSRAMSCPASLSRAALYTMSRAASSSVAACATWN